MATVKKGMLTSAGEWWKHLRWTKRVFWKGERKAAERDVQNQVVDEVNGHYIDAEINEITDRHRDFYW